MTTPQQRPCKFQEEFQAGGTCSDPCSSYHLHQYTTEYRVHQYTKFDLSANCGCKPGKYLAGGKCEGCELGKLTETWTAGSCTFCSKGQYQREGASSSCPLKCADLVDTRASSGEVPSIKVGIGESNERAVHHHAGIPFEALNHRGAALPRESGRPTGGARVPDFWAVRPGPRDSPQADVPGPRGPKRLFCSKYLARACATGCCPGCLLASDVQIYNPPVPCERAPSLL